MQLRSWLLVVGVTLVIGVGTVCAEDDPRTRAADAYADAEQAALQGDFARAAQLFELADSLAPTPQALRSAARSRIAAGHNVVALSLAEELLARYPDDARSRALADELHDLLAPRYVRVDVECGETCTLRVDGLVASAKSKTNHALYVFPGEHMVSAHFGDGTMAGDVARGGAGDAVALRLVNPTAAALPVAAAETATQAQEADGNASATAAAPAQRQLVARGMALEVDGVARANSATELELPTPYLVIGGITTAALGAAALWSGRDTMSAYDEYQLSPSLSGFEDGERRERRTNVLLGATAVSAAITVGIAVLGARVRAKETRGDIAVGVEAGNYTVGLRGDF